MIVKVAGAEITDAKIDFISLVSRGANLSPFKIIKAEDVKPATAVDKFKQSIHKTPDPAVTVVIADNDKADQVKVAIEKSGMSVADVEVVGDVTLFKQEGYDADAEPGSMLCVGDNVGVGFDRVFKHFTAYPDSDKFEDQVSGANFFPSIHQASEALMDTLYMVMYGDNDRSASVEKVADAVKAFGTYVTGQVSNLPETVLKLEGELNQTLESTKVDDSTQSDTSGDNQMTDKVQKEAVPGDLDGLSLEDTPTVDASAPEGAEVEKAYKTGKKKVKKGDDVVEVEYQYELDADGNEIFLSFVEKQEDAPVATDKAAATGEEAAPEVTEAKVEKSLTAEDLQAALSASLKDALAPLNDRLDAVEKGTAEAVAKAESTVIHVNDGDLDQSLSHLGDSPARITKSETSENLWAGTLDFNT